MGSQNKFNFSIKIGLFILDILIVFLFFNVFITLQYKYYYPSHLDRLPYFSEILVAHYKAILLILFSWILIADYSKLYSIKRLNYLREIIRKVIYHIFYFSIIIFMISSLKSEDLLSVQLVGLYILSLFSYLLITRFFIFYFSRREYERGRNLKNILIIGENINSIRFKKILESRRHFGMNIIENEGLDFNKSKYLINQNNIKEVFISQSGLVDNDLENQILNYCEDNHIGVNYIPYSLNNDLISLEVNYIDTLPIFKLKKYPLEKVNNQIIKSLVDIFLSSIICVFILSWLFPIITLLIKLDSKGPVIFKQKRRGLNGKEFDCYKFRTMRNDGTNSIKATVVNDNRITRIGHFLRKTSLDEFPQFLNVLKGDMSIVGPRPHMISQDMHYSEIIRKYNLRNYVKPGITGLSQVKGFRGAIDCDKDMEDRIRTDIFYVRNWSLLLDIQIIYQTVVLVFKGDENAI
ncbi:exopolysaccharide biosynthesis polyprenyl glycosylphosphotransferase [Empedobacter stercoris]|uniref:exopolysaccharide biosynthesis polyprenyl glycosylphosphotransferase n=1 Tax=Empedobacter stercoris TaxID=1628248 RepID=UPI001CE0E565|nr:exopolysaccharide biosynthesis polyprenyl glycosylphosphotransferase [Empedobacter stercoris]MCA4776660.1 exopolysaccharide biosynthesis polyprenyl glycosylphosphotransferase [Empedobacter stercoris]